MFKKWYVKIVNWFWRCVYGEYTTAEKEKLYNDLADVRALEQFLLNHNFYWASDGLNACIELDTFARPEQTLARGWGNCGDYMRLYEEFIKFSGCAKKYVQYEMTCDNSLKYHYVMEITMSDSEILIQNNMDLFAFAAFYEIGSNYDNVKIIDKWERGL